MEEQESLAGGAVRSSRFAISLLGILLCVLPSAGCQPSSSARGSPKVTLKIGVALPNVRQQKSIEAIAEMLTSEVLVNVGFDGRPQPALAESWESLPGGLGLRLKVRPGVHFHNGQVADAESIVRILRDQIASFERQGWRVSDNVSGIKALSDRDIVIQYRRPDAFVLLDLSLFGIVDPGDRGRRTGPFKVSAASSSLSLVAYDRYDLGRPSIDAVEVTPYETTRKAWIAMMRGEVNSLYEVSREAADFVEAESGVRSYSFLRPYHIALVFNQRHPVLSRHDVRIALNEAVDRDAVVRSAMRGRGVPADGPIWPYHWAYSSAQRSFAYNPDAARLRLDAAGLTPKRQRMPGEMTSRFRFTCLVPSDDTRFERIALVIQRQLFDVGVDMEIRALPAMEMLRTRVAPGDFDAFLFEMSGGRNLSWLYRFWHSPGEGTAPPLRTGYMGADNALDRLRGAQSDDETRLAISELQRVLYEDPPAVFLVWPRETRAVDARFNVPYLRDRDVLGALRDWRLAAPYQKASR